MKRNIKRIPAALLAVLLLISALPLRGLAFADPILYEIDASGVRPRFVCERFCLREVGLLIRETDADGSTSTLLGDICDIRYRLRGETEWIPCDWENTSFNEPCELEMRAAYRGAELEFPLRIVQGPVFTVDASALDGGIPQFSSFTLENTGIKAWADYNGVRTDLTQYLDLCERDAEKSPVVNTMECRDVTLEGSIDVWLNLPERGRDVYFKVPVEPVSTRIVPGDVTGIALDLSETPTILRSRTSYSAYHLNVNVIETLRDGTTRKMQNPYVRFRYKSEYQELNLSGEMGQADLCGTTVYSGSEIREFPVTVSFNGLEQTFTARVLPNPEMTVEMPAETPTFREFLDPITVETLGVRVWKTELGGEPEDVTDSIDVIMSEDSETGKPVADLYYDNGTHIFVPVNRPVPVELRPVTLRLDLKDFTPTVKQYSTNFRYEADLYAEDGNESILLAENVEYWATNADGISTVNKIRTLTPGTVRIEPWLPAFPYEIGSRPELQVEVTVEPYETTYELNTDNLITDVEIFTPYSIDNCGATAAVVTPDGDLRWKRLYFTATRTDGAVFEDRVPTGEPGEYTLRFYVENVSLTDRIYLGEPYTLTVRRGDTEVEFVDVSCTQNMLRFGSYSCRGWMVLRKAGEEVARAPVTGCRAVRTSDGMQTAELGTLDGEFLVYVQAAYNGETGECPDPVRVTVTDVEASPIREYEAARVRMTAGRSDIVSFTAPRTGCYRLTTESLAESPVTKWTYMAGYDKETGDYLCSESIAPGSETEEYAHLQEGQTALFIRRSNDFVSFDFLLRIEPAHNTVFEAGEPATCTEPGTAPHYLCRICGQTFRDAEAAEPMDPATGPLPHTPGEWHEAAAASCTQEGTPRWSICAVCGQTLDENGEAAEIQPFPALGHDFAVTHVQEPDCARDGWVEYTCSRDASHVYRDGIPATGLHVDESDDGVCDVCGLVLREPAPVETREEAVTGVRAVLQKLQEFFSKIADFFRRLFGG